MWQQSTAVSSTRASLMPALAANFKNILEDLGEDTNRPGLIDTPNRAAQALLFFTKGYEDRFVSILKTLFIDFFLYYWQSVFYSTFKNALYTFKG